jgi:hypothetical protein
MVEAEERAMTYEQRARLEDAIERYANAKALEEVVTDFETKAMCSRHTQDAWGEVSRLLTRLEEIEEELYGRY